MKKLAALLLALMLALTAFAVFAEDTDNLVAEEEPALDIEAAEPVLVEIGPGKVVGTWYGVYAESGNLSYNPTGDIHLDINRDKSGVLVINGTEQSFTWVIDSDKMAMRLNTGSTEALNVDPKCTLTADGELIVEYVKDGLKGLTGAAYSTYTFIRENQIMQLPEAAEAAVEDEFYGRYQLAWTMDDTRAVLPNEDNVLTVRVDFAEAEITQGEESETFVTEFTDGCLTTDVTPNNQFMRRNCLGLDKEYSIVKLSKTTDDTLFLATASNASGEIAAVFYLRRLPD